MCTSTTRAGRSRSPRKACERLTTHSALGQVAGMRTISRITFSLVLATTLIGTGCAEQKGKKDDKKADKKDAKQDAEKQ